MTIYTVQDAYRILLVEDKDADRLAIKELIGPKIGNCVFEEARTVQAAEELLTREGPFDLVIIDLCFGEAEDRSGLELLRPTKPLHAWSGQTRIIVYTGCGSVETCCQAYESGASAYVDKRSPSAPQRLVQKAKELLELREVREFTRRQLEAQYAADHAFAANRDAWLKSHAGRFVLWRTGRVIASLDDADAVMRYLAKCTEDERAETGIVRIR